MSCRCSLYALIVLLGVSRVLNGQLGYCSSGMEFNDPAPDYCQQTEQPHLGCNHSTNFAAACGKHAKIIPITQNIKNIILRQHNAYRNIVAKGSLHLLPTAGRMLKMKWDPNLAQLAEYAVRECRIERVTQSFSTTHATRPGFNAVYNVYPKTQDQDELKILSAQLRAWYDEYRHVTLDKLLSHHSQAGREISHFLQIATALNDRVGCAIVKYEEDLWKTQLMICLYGCFKPQGQLAYAIGQLPGDKCKCGVDRQFKNLCNITETVGDCGLISDHNLEDDEFEPLTTTTMTTTTTTTTTTKKPDETNIAEKLLDWILNHQVGL